MTMPTLPWPFSTSLHLKFQLVSLFCRTHVFVDVYSSGAPVISNCTVSYLKNLLHHFNGISGTMAATSMSVCISIFHDDVQFDRVASCRHQVCLVQAVEKEEEEDDNEDDAGDGDGCSSDSHINR
jgi:hypothetical protein